ncbi:MAG: recombinase family protein [Lachnospiraceae bacterium]|nr:recombinase family protein [Lachnospiraceae bacterium]
MERAVMYMRLSRQDEGKEENRDSESIENQRMLLKEYAGQHGYQIVKEYVDEDCSGLNEERPGFQQMIRDARKGMFDVILAKSQSRFSRNMNHVEKYLHREFPLLGIRFLGVVDGTDSGSHRNKKARQIYGLINEWYCEDLSDSVKAVLHRKVRDGEFIGSFAPYGYRKSQQNRHLLVPDPGEAQIVRDIFMQYAGGNSMRQICRYLEEQEIKPPGVGKCRDDSARTWNAMTIKRILTNEVYLGHMLQGKSVKQCIKETKRRYVRKEEWVRREHTHEPILSEELFKQVQSRLKR